jgi:hypothetical protein
VHFTINGWGNPWVMAWNLLAAVPVVWAVVRLAQTPIERFEHGTRSRAWRMLFAVSALVSIAGFVLPLGALWQLNNPPQRREVTQ